MKPLPVKHRSFYFIGLVLFFLVAAPVIALYSSGINVGKDLSLSASGGIYVSPDIFGTTITIDGKVYQPTTPLQRGVFVDNLTPGLYAVKVTKPSYTSWQKKVVVRPRGVSEVYPFLSDASSTPRLLTASTTPVMADAEILFLDQTQALSVATTSRRSLELKAGQTGLTAIWHGSIDNAPYIFCVQTEQCQATTTVYASRTIKGFAFYPGREDVAIVRDGNDLVVVDLDPRAPKNRTVLYSSPLPYDQRMNDQMLYIESAGNYFAISL